MSDNEKIKEQFNKRGERHSHRMDFTGERTKGRRVGSLWWSATKAEGDITFNFNFEGLTEAEKLDAITDFIGMLEREGEHWQAMIKKQLNKFFNQLAVEVASKDKDNFQ